MPTVGNTAKPTNTQEFFGLNSTNQMAQLITMPAGGPWLITAIAAWIGGVNMTATAQLCVWGTGGALLQASGQFTVANHGGLALGASGLYSSSGFSILINGGDSVYVGWWRHPSHSVQNGRFSSGSHLHDTAGAAPETLSGFSTDSSGGLGAYVADYQTANNPPNAPTLTTGGVQHNGRSVYYSWVHSDPDGNPQNSAHWQLWTTDQLTLLDDVSGLGLDQALWRTLPAGYGANNEYAYRVRTYDGSLWGAWSGFAVVRPNTAPDAPVINSPPTNTLTPAFTAGANDPDGNSIATMRYRVHRASDSAQMWDSGEGSFNQTYAGSPLSYGSLYLVEGQVKDQWGAYSPWSSYVYWTPVNPVVGAPTLSPNTTATKQNTLTPSLTVSHGSAFTDYEIEINTPSGPIVQTISEAPFAAVTSKIVATFAGLSWGQEYHYRARVLVSGVWSSWSSYAAFKINAQPTSPTLTVESDAGVPAVSAGGVLVTTDAMPIIRAPFSDPDKIPYGDTASARSVEIRRQDTQAAVTGYPRTTGTGDTTKIEGAAGGGANTTLAAASAIGATNIKVTAITGIAVNDILRIDALGNLTEYRKVTAVGTAGSGGTGITLATALSLAHSSGVAVVEVASVLTVNVIYEARVGFRDNAGQPAATYAYSPWTQFKYSLPPTPALTAPANASTVIESTPVIDWSATFSGTKTQSTYRVRIYDKGPIGANYSTETLAHDTGVISSSASEWTVPRGVLLDDHDYRWTVTITDTDGLEATLT